MTPEEYVRHERIMLGQIAWLQGRLAEAREEAEKYPAPEKRRPAKPSDLVPRRIIWHCRKPGDGGWFWNIVIDVVNSNDRFKAYVADDGCRYGLENAWVSSEE